MNLTQRQVKWLRVGAVVALVAAFLVIARVTGLDEALTRDNLRAHVAAAGVWGIPLYLGAFCLALLLHVPATGMAFVAVGVTLFGRLEGGALAFTGSMVAVIVSFIIVRAVGGRPLAEVKNRFARRILARLESHPLLTVIVLRLIFFAGAPMNYALALSAIRFRDYALGSLIGMAPVVVVLALFF